MEFMDKVQCEEIGGMEEQLTFDLSPYEGDIMTFISENLLIEAQVSQGLLKGAKGYIVKAEQVEMNNVKVTFKDKVIFYELNPRVRWMEVEIDGQV